MINNKFENNEAVVGQIEAAADNVAAAGIDNGNEYSAISMSPCTFHC